METIRPFAASTTVMPGILLLELRYRTVTAIEGLPFFAGPHFSALFRHALRRHLPAGLSLADAGIAVSLAETGRTAFDPDEPLFVGLTCPASLLPAVTAALRDFNASGVGEGHFQAGRTLRLDAAVCRVGGSSVAFGADDAASAVEAWTPRPLALSDLHGEIDTLQGLESFRLVLASPLRLTRPAGAKAERHRYADEDFFLEAPDRGAAALDHLLRKVRLPGEGDAPLPPSGLMVSGGGLLWVDVPYGFGAFAKTLGGVMGTLRIVGRPARAAAERLVLGQYVGVGKNPAFGLGYYAIPELAELRTVRALGRGTSLLERAVAPERLRGALSDLKDSSPGPDGLRAADLKKAGEALLVTLAEAVRSGSYQPGPVKKYRIPKASGGFRELTVQNMADRLLQKAVADVLAPAVDRLLSSSSYAYRAGLNRQGAAAALRGALREGYTQGVKADVAAFFDTVDQTILADLLSGLFPADPLPERLASWLAAAAPVGLPQGSPLSPVLSNLYLDRFDRDAARAGLKLIRYADDFVALFRGGGSAETLVSTLGESLRKLRLSLQKEKTAPLRPCAPIAFLGYEITAEEVVETERRDEGEEEGPWTPVFREEWREGQPVYLTTICRGAFSSGAHLVVKDDRDQTRQIPWNRISRLVVVGRSPFSGGVVYRAVREEIPVTFIDVMGRVTGQLHPSGHEIPAMAALQEEKARDAAFCLALARQLVAAKISNARVLLRRNGVQHPELREMAEKAETAESLDVLRGYEGAAARFYFAALAGLVQPFSFDGRNYNPPRDPVNVLLSFGYTLLYNRIAVVLKDHGFNPRTGFFHQGRGGHLALASDLLEPLRHMVERVVLALIHRGEIGPDDFATVQRQGVPYCRLEGGGFRKMVRRYEQVMATPFTPDGCGRMTANAYLDEMIAALRRTMKLDIPFAPLRID